jgi:cytochrome P450
LGNLPDIPPVHSWFRFKEWADKYGSVFRLNLMGRNLVVVSTEKVANDLLRERGTLYSSREQSPMAAQLVSGNLRPLLLPYGGEYSLL